MARFTTRPLLLRAGVLALVLTLSGGLPAAPAVADDVLPDLRVTAAFDKERYIGSDLVKVTVTITNVGAVDAPNVRGATGGDVQVGDIWADPDAEPVTIAAGETRVAELSGPIWNVTDHVITLGGSVSSNSGDANHDDNGFAIQAAFADATGTFGGSIFTDPNANGTIDAGESGLSGVTIKITGGLPSGEYTRTTDAQGGFSFAGIPTGRYSLEYTAPPGWIVYGITGGRFESVIIDDTGQYADVRIPAVRPLWNTLDVTFWFDRDTYQVGETAHVTVVLTNIGDHALTGITARCGGGDHYLRGGPGWGPLAPGGPGVTVPASGTFVRTVTRTVTVSDPVPEAAAKFGYVGASCEFSVAGYPVDPPIFASATARVPGVAGAGQGQIYHDGNSNGWPDDGEAVAGARVVLTDPDTGAAVASPVTDASGEFAVDDLPSGEYDLRVDGQWKPDYGPNWYRFVVAAAELHYGQRFSVEPGTERENRLPNLKVSAAFDKPAYNSGDQLLVRVSVTNIGESAAEGVRASGGGRGPQMSFDSNAFGDFRPWGPGARIAAGETRVIEVPGTVWVADSSVVTFSVGFESTNGDVNPMNNGASSVARVTATRGTHAGVLYGDRNDNGALDPGEELGRVRISISGGVPIGDYSQLTDSRGRFAFRDIPTGRYSVSYELPAGWTLPYTRITVDEQEQDVLVRAVRSAFAVLDASIAFTKGSYEVGETAHLTVTLTNRGSTELTGITAFCSGPGNGNEIYSSGPGWGDLDYNGPGVTVGARETRRFDVWDTVPEGALSYGYVVAGCSFGSPPEAEGSAPAGAEARVPGATGTESGWLIHDRDSNGFSDGEGVPDTKVVLIDEFTGSVVARTVTDARGHFVFADVPAYHYELRVVGPWRFAADGYRHFQVFGENEAVDRHQVFVLPGPEQPDPDARQEDAPAALGGVGPAAAVRTGLLAATGASVIELSIAGLAALVVGLGLVLVFRRRRPAG